MKRKRFVKLLMANGMNRRQANQEAESARKSYGFESYDTEYLKRKSPLKDTLRRMQEEFKEAYGAVVGTIWEPWGFGASCLKTECTWGVLGDAEDAGKKLRKEFGKCLRRN